VLQQLVAAIFGMLSETAPSHDCTHKKKVLHFATTNNRTDLGRISMVEQFLDVLFVVSHNHGSVENGW